MGTNSSTDETGGVFNNMYLHFQYHYLVLCRSPHFSSIFFQELFTDIDTVSLHLSGEAYFTKLLPVRHSRYSKYTYNAKSASHKER